MPSERSNAQITAQDLKELLVGSEKRLSEYFISGEGSKWQELYDIKKPLCVALCQGAAMHFNDKKNGVKDFDVWFFYPFNQKHLPYRTMWNWDYQNKKFGRHPNFSEYKGRKVDVIVRSIKNYIVGDPVGTIFTYFEKEKTDTSKLLAQKAVVLLSPEKYSGKTIWYKRKIA
ncbi:MAG: hypothetical protein OEY59_12135 [Deltaproteobacteria bacterium]|nr:hypothetical protein [Deltaproteobacteria bacterium]